MKFELFVNICMVIMLTSLPKLFPIYLDNICSWLRIVIISKTTTYLKADKSRWSAAACNGGKIKILLTYNACRILQNFSGS